VENLCMARAKPVENLTQQNFSRRIERDRGAAERVDGVFVLLFA